MRSRVDTWNGGRRIASEAAGHSGPRLMARQREDQARGLATGGNRACAAMERGVGCGLLVSRCCAPRFRLTIPRVWLFLVGRTTMHVSVCLVSRPRSYTTTLPLAYKMYYYPKHLTGHMLIAFYGAQLQWARRLPVTSFASIAGGRLATDAAGAGAAPTLGHDHIAGRKIKHQVICVY